MSPTLLTLVDHSTKWGLVMIYDEQRRVVREQIISAAEADAVSQSVKGHPSCVSREQWETGMVESATFNVLPGQACPGEGGALNVGLSLEDRPPFVHSRILQLQPHEWRAEDGVVFVDGPALMTIKRAGW